MTEAQRKLRDEFAVLNTESTCWCSGPMCYGCEKKSKQLICIGHDFAHERAQVLVEALETIIAQNADMSDGDIRDSWHQQARAALAEWRGSE